MARALKEVSLKHLIPKLQARTVYFFLIEKHCHQN